jgi:hypothetical protein
VKPPLQLGVERFADLGAAVAVDDLQQLNDLRQPQLQLLGGVDERHRSSTLSS